MDPETDPRIYFAAERTLLAWVRTGIGVMAFGFVVARFGLFLRLVRGTGEASGHGLSPYLGAALVLLGVFATAAGATQYRRFYRQLRPADLPSPRAPLWPLALAWTLVGLGAALTAILLV
jgi:putative membrane protein